MTDLVARIEHHLQILVEVIGARPPGSAANRQATDHLVTTLRACGLTVETLPFTARWWEPGPATLELSGRRIAVPAAPFSRPCDVAGTIRRLSSAAELDRAQPEPGGVLVIEGELTAEPLFPKGFPFLDLLDQRVRIARLEALVPAVVVAIVETQGAFSFFEDPDLAFPYLVVDRGTGDLLRPGTVARVTVEGRLQEGPGVNVAAHSGGAGPRTVVSAHVDSKVTTPGAFDNAGGVAALLALAESGLSAAGPVELVFFNGEDHYAAPGEQAWLAATDLSSVRLMINVDGAGVAGRRTSLATFACPDELVRDIEAAASRSGWVIDEPWYESDHAILAMRGIPSLAITSAGVHELLADLAHTERDTLDVVDPALLAGVTRFIADWLERSSA